MSLDLAPFDTGLIETRLRDALVGAGQPLRQVAGAADYRAVKALKDFPAPCAYVVLDNEAMQPHPAGNAPRGVQVAMGQIVPVVFGVAIAVRNYREQRGAQMKDGLRDVVGRVRGRLLGWVPDVRGGRPCRLQRGYVDDYDDATLLWIDMYQTQHSIGSTT